MWYTFSTHCLRIEKNYDSCVKFIISGYNKQESGSVNQRSIANTNYRIDDIYNVCVEYCNNNNEYYLYYIRNDNVIGENYTYEKIGVINGKKKLNFDKLIIYLHLLVKGVAIVYVLMLVMEVWSENSLIFRRLKGEV